MNLDKKVYDKKVYDAFSEAIDALSTIEVLEDAAVVVQRVGKLLYDRSVERKQRGATILAKEILTVATT